VSDGYVPSTVKHFTTPTCTSLCLAVLGELCAGSLAGPSAVHHGLIECLPRTFDGDGANDRAVVERMTPTCCVRLSLVPIEVSIVHSP
jgi:hypothetical protein